MASFTVDPRLYDGVILDLQPADEVQALALRLTQAGIATAARGTSLVATAAQLGVAPERSVVISADEAGMWAARDGGFAVVVGVNQQGNAGELANLANVVVPELAAIKVRIGDKRMSECPNVLDCDDQVIGKIVERSPLICLDYDGTLSSIVADPDAAKLVEGAAEVLRQLAAQCSVAILSGRDLADIHARVGVPGIWYAGSHGFELIGPDGSRHQYDAACAALDILTDAAAELGDQVGQIPGARVEHKRFAVAMHYRNVAADQVAEVVAAAHRQGLRRGLRITSGRKVVELRPDVDWDKGTALTWIGERIHQAGPVLPVYLGDDLTDEDAFDAVRLDGIGIVVRHSEDGNRPTAASFTVNNPAEVCEFLRRVSERLRIADARF